MSYVISNESLKHFDYEKTASTRPYCYKSPESGSEAKQHSDEYEEHMHSFIEASYKTQF